MYVKLAEKQRGNCDSRKIWKFPTDKDDDIVTIKHYGTDSCSPLKPEPETILSKEINSTCKKDIYYLIWFHCVKVSKYGVISGQYFPVFGPEISR